MVTPEAVPLELEPAGLPSRILARLIDGVIQAAVLTALLIAYAAVGNFPGGVTVALVFLMFFLLLFAYPVALETLWRGRTVGKSALGLRVVTVEGGPVRFRHAAIRAVLALFEIYALSGAIAIVTVLFSKRNQRLGDMAAGTLVLRERSGLRAPVSVMFGSPPGLEAYTASVDTAAMTADDYAAVRAFLMRAPSLPFAIRADLALRLANPLARRLRPEPPAGLHPETYLACLAAAYQRGGASPATYVPPPQPQPAQPQPDQPWPAASAETPAPNPPGDFAPPS
ncbi:MAG: hypothetical protein JWO37_889 [Acidimicrobiales bacterium]|jgi:uncharacterized RDD family membrane protein YckC|nr:hypothetical protein [Acidimicrobiales bacterium]